MDGILRVVGRLAPLGFETKHPTILLKLSHFTHLIVRDSHVKCGHSGLNHNLAVLCERYWVTGATATVHRIINLYNQCRLKAAKPGKQLMTELPRCAFAAWFPTLYACRSGLFRTLNGSSTLQ